MKKEDVDKFHENLNNDIDKIIENNECDEENIKPSYIFLTVSIICLVYVFEYLKGFCILGFVLGCIWFFTNEIEIPKKPKRKKIQKKF